MEKYKYILKNIGILTIGQFSSKILIFLLVPIYTSVLSTEEYGSYDAIYTTVNLLIPILTVDVCTSAQRFCLDEHSDKKLITKICLKYTIIGYIGISVLLFINQLIGFSEVLSKYQFYAFGLFFILALNGIFVELALGQEKIRQVAISGVVSTFSTVMLNVYSLIIMKQGIDGYFIANILGPATQTMYLFWVLKIKNSIIYHKKIDKVLEKEILKFSYPQIANSISWWINNAADRYVVIFFCGIASNGIYSVAYKVPAILNMIGNIVSQASSVSIVKNYDVNDTDGFFSNTYTTYSFLMAVVCSAIIFITKPISKIMFANNFYTAWHYIPLLMVASMLGAMSGFLGGVFSAKKESKKYAQSTMIGAATNIVFNFILVPILGAYGAAIATVISYFVIWILRLYHAKHYVSYRLDIKRDVVAYCVLIVQGIVLCMELELFITYFLQTVCFFIVIFLYKRMLKNIILRLQVKIMKTDY